MNKTILLLERLGNLVQHALREDAKQLGLQPVHLQILAFLHRANRYSDLPIAVAEYLGLTRGTVSQSIKLLEQKGLLIKHVTHPHARKQHLQLTARGREAVATGWLHKMRTLLMHEQPSSDQLESTLETLLTTLQRAQHGKPFGVCNSCVFHQRHGNGSRCGLTGERLHTDEIELLCREWQDAAQAA